MTEALVDFVFLDGGETFQKAPSVFVGGYSTGYTVRTVIPQEKKQYDDAWPQ